MHPRESIPNVGRRARGHRAATFTLKGNSVSRTTTTTTTASATTQNASSTTTAAAVTSKLLPLETGDVYSNNGHVRGACAECGCVEPDEEGVVGAGEDSVHFHHPHHHHHFHHHPYGRILQRLARRRQITSEPDTHSRLELDPQGDYVPSPTQAATRAGRNLSNAHSHRPSPRTEEQRSTHNPTRWKGSKTARRNQTSEEHTPQQFFPRQSRSEKPGRMDLSGGCLTGRNPASHPPDGGDASPEMPDTTRSEPGDTSTMNRLARRQVARGSNHDDLLDELFDYYWVYQGMGRQVLNLDLPREVWDKKLLRRPAKLPPISAAQEEAVTEQTHPGEGGHHRSRQTGHRSRRSEKAFPGRRALSEPACSPNALQSQVFGARDKEIHNRLLAPVSHTSGSNSNGLVFEPPSFPRRTTRDLDTNHTTRKLVVKMPVMTKDKTRLDLLDKDG